MLAAEDRPSIGWGEAWDLFKVQTILALVWAGGVAALARLRGDTGVGRTVLGPVLLGARLSSGMLWFSIGWLGAAEHGLADRQVAMAGGVIGATASVFGLAASPDARRRGVAGFLDDAGWTGRLRCANGDGRRPPRTRARLIVASRSRNADCATAPHGQFA